MEKLVLMQLPVNYDALNSDQRREVREEYIKLQDGLCYLCKQPLSGPPLIDISRGVATYPVYRIFAKSFFSHKVHLHHSHRGENKGMTLGAVHAMCNAWLKLFAGE